MDGHSVSMGQILKHYSNDQSISLFSLYWPSRFSPVPTGSAVLAILVVGGRISCKNINIYRTRGDPPSGLVLQHNTGCGKK